MVKRGKRRGKTLPAKIKNRKEEENIIERYTDLSKPSAYTYPEKIKRESGIGIKKIKSALESEPSYYLYRKAIHNFPRQRVIVSQANYQYAIDLKDVSRYANDNNNIRYILCMVDCFSRYALCYPMVNKKAETSENALSELLNRLDSPCKKLQADRGGEFFNRRIEKLLKKKNITLFATFEYSIKASLVERFQKSLMRMIHKFMEKNNSTHYIDSLDKIVNNYNMTFNKAVGMSPLEAHKDENSGIVADNLFKKGYSPKKSRVYSSPTPQKFKKGDSVIITRKKTLFFKEYSGSFRPEIFTIHSMVRSNPNVYKVGKLWMF